jgi:glutathione S-transferase
MITVYQLEHSPFCIPVTAILRSLGTPFETVNITNSDRHEIIELTGGEYYQVPVLVDESAGGCHIYESSAESQDVARYLDTHYADGRLFPARYEGLQSLILGHLENEVEGITFRIGDPSYLDGIADLQERTMIIRHKERRFGRGCIEQWRRDRDALMATATRLLTPYEQMLDAHPFLLGDAPVYSDFLLLGILGNMTWNGNSQFPSSLPALAEWQRRTSAFRF